MGKLPKGELDMASNQATIDDFMNAHAAQGSDSESSGEYDERETLKAERDVVYEGYIIESYAPGIEGKFGVNTAVHITSPDGEKMTLWVSGYEEQHFNSFMKATCKEYGLTDTQGTLSAPIKVAFMRSQEPNKAGDKKYNRLRLVYRDSGEDVQFELDSF